MRALVCLCALMGLISIRGYSRRSTPEHLSLASSTNCHKLQLGFAREFTDPLSALCIYLYIMMKFSSPEKRCFYLNCNSLGSARKWCSAILWDFFLYFITSSMVLFFGGRFFFISSISMVDTITWRIISESWFQFRCYYNRKKLTSLHTMPKVQYTHK